MKCILRCISLSFQGEILYIFLAAVIIDSGIDRYIGYHYNVSLADLHNRSRIFPTNQISAVFSQFILIFSPRQAVSKKQTR